MANYKTVEANGFVPKDADGKVRAKIGMGLIFNTKMGPAIVVLHTENSLEPLWLAHPEKGVPVLARNLHQHARFCEPPSRRRSAPKVEWQINAQRKATL